MAYFKVPQGVDIGYAPGYQGVEAGRSDITVDPNGAQVTRSTVLTDEGSYRTNFSGSEIYVTIGTCTFTNGSDVVTGTALDTYDVHFGDYIKLGTDADTAYAQIAEITTTQIILASNYSGAGGTGTGRCAILVPKIGDGGSLTISNGSAIIAAGTTATSVMELERDSDYLPLLKQSRLTISNRIANQDAYLGFYDEANGSNAKFYAWFRFNGTNDRLVICETASSRAAVPAGGEIESTTIQLPNGVRTNTGNTYRVELSNDKCVFVINNVIVATHTQSLPRPMDFLTSTFRVVNGTTPGTSVSYTIDYDMVNNFNKANVTIAGKDEALPISSMSSVEGAPAVIVSPQPLRTYRYGFARSVAYTANFDVLSNGVRGTATSVVGGGKLSIVNSTATNSELILRCKTNQMDAWRLTGLMAQSNRTGTQELHVEMVDVMGDGISWQNSGTTVTVTKTNHGLETGMSVSIGAVTTAGTATIVPGRYGVVSTPTSDAFIMSCTGALGASTGTCTIYGMNYVRLTYPGPVTNTSAHFDSGRWGYANGTTLVSINTPVNNGGHIFHIYNEDGQIGFADATSTITTAFSLTERAGRLNNTPDNNVPMYLQIRTANMQTSTPTVTTWSFDFLQVDDVANMPVSINGGKISASPNVPPVRIHSSATLTVSSGGAAHDSAVSGNPFRMAGRALTANYTAVSTGDTADLVTTLVGALITRENSIPDLSQTVSTTVGTTGAVALFASAGAAIRNYITDMSLLNLAPTTSCIFSLLDGTTPVFSTPLTANMTMPIAYNFQTPIRGAGTTAMNCSCSAAANVYVYLGGFKAP